jgi:phosphopantothenoylcysteine decarboxylase/phosphopantothenate--cysteine ligase
MLASHLAAAGHEVTLLRARGSESPAAPCREETFSTFAELDAALGRILAAERLDAIIHAAAVGDFGVDEVLAGGASFPPGRGKLGSAAAPIVRLRLNPKLVDGLRARSLDKSARIVAFKLTQGAAPGEVAASVRALFEHSGADIVVHNDLSERQGPDAFPATLHFADGRPPERCAGRPALASALERIVSLGTDAPGAREPLCSSASI